MTTKQFVIRFISLSLLSLVLIGLFNRIVDPFWYFQDIEIKGFNAVKLAFRNYERHVKPHWLVREQPEAIILGNSISEIGFDPNNVFFTDRGRLKGMNFAYAGALWDLVQCEFEFAVTHAHIKRALIGFYPENLPVANCAKDFATLGQINMGELLLSIPAIRASKRTIRNQKTEKPSHTRDGMYFFGRGLPGVDSRFGIDYRRHVNEKPQCPNAINTTDIPFNSVAERRVDLSGLRKMIRTAQEHGVELVLYAYPHHVYREEWDRQCDEEVTHWHAMKQIATLIEAEATPDQVRAWQFYGYNDITTEPIGIGTTAKYWQDSRHYNFEVGDMMLADIFGENPDRPKLGRPIATKSIEADYQDFLQERAEYLRHHPEFYPDLQRLQHICTDQPSKCRPVLLTLGLPP